ncbi:MAG: transcription elongation factor GreA [Lachnospiraceae bacterium]|jgi:transcription elongation factor GreA|nr:transcription elongation factor GreA [Lachnospiraceae bacterium]
MYDELTKSDIEKMEKEIEYRKLVLRKELIGAVKEARAQGDLSENFEYYAAKREKNQNESRIRYLERMIKTAHIISDDSKEDEVGINNRVTIFLPEDDEEETYRIITTIRGNSLQGLISIDSPLGKALMGHKVGEEVMVKVNEDYSYPVVIRAIDKSINDTEDTIRKF